MSYTVYIVYIVYELCINSGNVYSMCILWKALLYCLYLIFFFSFKTILWLHYFLDNRIEWAFYLSHFPGSSVSRNFNFYRSGVQTFLYYWCKKT